MRRHHEKNSPSGCAYSAPYNAKTTQRFNHAAFWRDIKQEERYRLPRTGRSPVVCRFFPALLFFFLRSFLFDLCICLALFICLALNLPCIFHLPCSEFAQFTKMTNASPSCLGRYDGKAPRHVGIMSMWRLSNLPAERLCDQRSHHWCFLVKGRGCEGH